MRRKVFSALSLLIIAIGITITVILVRTGSLFEIFAGPGENPKNIKITNLSDSSFTVSYTTDDQVIGTITIGKNPGNLETIFLDDRDQINQNITEYKVHSISTKGLNPNTLYYFSITSGTKTFLNNGSPFNVRTASEISDSPSSHNPLSGRIIMPDGSTPSEGLVYASINGSQKISSYIKSNGNYTIPLNTIRNEALNSYYDIKSGDIINIEIEANNLFTSASVSENDISPVPLITLSNNYDFSGDKTIPTETPKGGFPTQQAPVRKIATSVTYAPTLIPTIEITPSPTLSITPTPTELSTTAITVTSTISPVTIIPPTGNSSGIIAVIAAVFAFGGTITFLLLNKGKTL